MCVGRAWLVANKRRGHKQNIVVLHVKSICVCLDVSQLKVSHRYKVLRINVTPTPEMFFLYLKIKWTFIDWKPDNIPHINIYIFICGILSGFQLHICKNIKHAWWISSTFSFSSSPGYNMWHIHGMLKALIRTNKMEKSICIGPAIVFVYWPIHKAEMHNHFL